MDLLVGLAVVLVVDLEPLDSFRFLLFGFHGLDREALVNPLRPLYISIYI